jgi:hypothetical protein
MAVNIKLSCARAWHKLKGGFILKTASKKVVLFFPNTAHIDAYGRSMELSKLVRILVNGSSDGHVPPRPFTRDAGIQLRHEVYAILRAYTNAKLKNTNDPANLGQIYTDFSDEEVSVRVTALVKQWLFDGSYYQATCPNAIKTIQNKGSDVPLVDSGALVNSITAKVIP